MTWTIRRHHDISVGHRVHLHESKCAHLHGHNYRVHFACSAPALDPLGRVIDFAVIKERLCGWLDANWDHRFLVWQDDPLASALHALDPDGVVAVPFNPTAECMAQYLVEVVGPAALQGTGVRLAAVEVEETAKCSATFAA